MTTRSPHVRLSWNAVGALFRMWAGNRRWALVALCTWLISLCWVFSLPFVLMCSALLLIGGFLWGAFPQTSWQKSVGNGVCCAAFFTIVLAFSLKTNSAIPLAFQMGGVLILANLFFVTSPQMAIIAALSLFSSVDGFIVIEGLWRAELSWALLSRMIGMGACIFMGWWWQDREELASRGQAFWIVTLGNIFFPLSLALLGMAFFVMYDITGIMTLVLAGVGSLVYGYFKRLTKGGRVLWIVGIVLLGQGLALFLGKACEDSHAFSLNQWLPYVSSFLVLPTLLASGIVAFPYFLKDDPSYHLSRSVFLSAFLALSLQIILAATPFIMLHMARDITG